MTTETLMGSIAQPGVALANYAVAFWASAHAEDIAFECEVAATRLADGRDATLAKAERLGLYRPLHALTDSGIFIMEALLKEVLEGTLGVLVSTPACERGLVIEQIISGAEDGSPQLRFALGHLLAEYVACFPHDARCLGTSGVSDEFTTVIWQTAVGVLIDVVRPRALTDAQATEHDLAAALTEGSKWSGFVGVRHLPLTDPWLGEVIFANGVRQLLLERNALHLHSA